MATDVKRSVVTPFVGGLALALLLVGVGMLTLTLIDGRATDSLVTTMFINAIVVVGNGEPRVYAVCLVLATTKLDVNGVVRFHHVVPGRYQIDVQATGYQQTSRTLVIEAGQEVPPIQFRLPRLF